MRGIWHVALHDARMQVVDRTAIFWMVLMPIGFILFFGTVLRGPSGPAGVTVSLPVVDRDQDFLSLAYAEQLRGESFRVRIYDAVTAESDTADLDPRFVTIPEGFTRTILSGEQATIRLDKEADSSVSYDMAADIRLHQAAVRFLSNLMRWNPPLPQEGQPAPEIDAASKGRFLSLVSEPPNVTIQSSHAGRGRPVPSGMGQSIPGMMAMFVVMAVMVGGSAALTKERDLGTLRRLASTTLSRGEVFGGKLMGLMFMGLAQAAILVVCSELFRVTGIVDVDFSWLGYLPGLIPLLLAYSFCIGAAGVLLSALFKTTQQAESLAWLVGMVFAGLGGCWWPLEIVPPTLRAVGHIFPTAWAMDGLHGLITFGHGAAGVVLPVAVLMGMGLVFTALGSRLMRIAD